MALSVYESNTNQRFVTSLIKQDGGVSASVSVNYTVLGLMSPWQNWMVLWIVPSQLAVSVWIQWMSRVELGLCGWHGDKQNWTYCFCRAVANGISSCRKSETYRALARNFSATESCESPPSVLKTSLGKENTNKKVENSNPKCYFRINFSVLC